MRTLYRHTQVSRTTIFVAATAWTLALWWVLRGTNPALTVMCLAVGCLLTPITTLTVIVRSEAISIFFIPGLIARRMAIRHICEVRVVRNRWYYGWGIRLTPQGWLWNVSGLGSVELRFDNGRRFRIGSDEPDKLAQVLRRELMRCREEKPHS